MVGYGATRRTWEHRLLHASALLSQVDLEEVPAITAAATARTEVATFAALRQAAYAALEGQPATWAAALADFAATASSLAAGQRAAADALGESLTIDEIPFLDVTAERAASVQRTPGNTASGSAVSRTFVTNAGKKHVGHAVRQGEALGSVGHLDESPAGLAGQLPRLQTLPGKRARGSDGRGRAAVTGTKQALRVAGEGTAALQSLPEQATVAERPPADPAHGAATVADLAAQPVHLSDPAAGHGAVTEFTGGAVAGVQTAGAVVVEDVAREEATLKQPPPAGIAAAANADDRAKAALLEQVMKV